MLHHLLRQPNSSNLSETTNGTSLKRFSCKLEDIVAESNTTIETTQFQEFLHIEYESMKIHTKLSELQYFIKDISRKCDK
jgi:hypothetical protein